MRFDERLHKLLLTTDDPVFHPARLAPTTSLLSLVVNAVVVCFLVEGNAKRYFEPIRAAA